MSKGKSKKGGVAQPLSHMEARDDTARPIVPERSTFTYLRPQQANRLRILIPTTSENTDHDSTTSKK